MECIRIELMLLSIGATYDCLLPCERIINEIVLELVEQLTACDGRVQYSTTNRIPILCDCERHKVLNGHCTLSEEGVLNGSSLMLC